MTREKVIELAREAGISVEGHPLKLAREDYISATCSGPALERFAALVAAHERQKHLSDIETWKAKAAEAEKWRAMALSKDPMQPGKAVQEIQREAAEREREECARIVDAEMIGFYDDDALLRRMSKAIRDRGGKA